MRKTILSITILLASLSASAQERSYPGNVGGNIGMGIPLTEFADTWGKDMFTLGAHLTLPARHIPFQLGAGFNYAAMGGTRQTVPVSVPNLAATEGRLAVKAKVLSYHLLLRFSPFKGHVRPYVDGLAGIRQFTTQSTIKVEGLHDPVQRERNANDFTLSAGWAAGLMIDLGESAYFEARAERFFTGKASYVDPTSIAVDDQGALQFNTLESGTGTLNLLVGVGFRF